VKVTVLGAGSWGTSLALILNQNHHQVTCWSYEKEDIENIKNSGQNKRFLPGVTIPTEIAFTNSLSDSLTESELIVMAVPAQIVRSVLEQLGNKISAESIWVSVAKGIEKKSLLRVSEILNQVGHISYSKIAVLSGPSHAEEVSRNIPTAVVAASRTENVARLVQNLFGTPTFRVYANFDVIGVELGGALKNIIALAAGICDGAGFGDNTKAALMTRGLVEITRLGTKCGAKVDTFAGLSGMGDLIVTCMSRHSRNRFVGEQIGKGRNLPEILKEMFMVAEGVHTTASAYELAKNKKVEMPITEQVYKTLYEDKSPQEAMHELMTRESKIENRID
jgi:glycerol-3-phosphate dehydrogenase (NAD(P)+)